MSTELIPTAAALTTIAERPWWLDDEQLQLIQRAGTLFSASSLVPKDYQGKGGLSNCVIALNMAARIGADPLMLMQNLYVVHGRPSWSAQFLIACFNQTGRFSPIRYRWSGTVGKDDWSCQAWSTDRETVEQIEGPVISIATAKKEGWYSKNGSKWQTIPQLMLMYRAAAWLVRTHAPEIAMGLPTAEESADIAEHVTNGHRPVNRMEAITAALSDDDDPAQILRDRIRDLDSPEAAQDIQCDIESSGLGEEAKNELGEILNQRYVELTGAA